MARGEIKKVGDMFDAYRKRLVAPEASVVAVAIEIVKDLWGIELKRGQLRYNPATKTLHLIGQSALRSEIKIREQEMLAHLKGRLGERGAPKKII